MAQNDFKVDDFQLGCTSKQSLSENMGGSEGSEHETFCGSITTFFLSDREMNLYEKVHYLNGPWSYSHKKV